MRRSICITVAAWLLVAGAGFAQGHEHHWSATEIAGVLDSATALLQEFQDGRKSDPKYSQQKMIDYEERMFDALAQCPEFVAARKNPTLAQKFLQFNAQEIIARSASEERWLNLLHTFLRSPDFMLAQIARCQDTSRALIAGDILGTMNMQSARDSLYTKYGARLEQVGRLTKGRH